MGIELIGVISVSVGGLFVGMAIGAWIEWILGGGA